MSIGKFFKDSGFTDKLQEKMIQQMDSKVIDFCIKKAIKKSNRNKNNTLKESSNSPIKLIRKGESMDYAYA